MKLFKILFFISSITFAQGIIPVPKATLSAGSKSAANLVINENYSDSVLFSVNKRFVIIDSISATTGITLQAESDAIADSNKFYNNIELLTGFVNGSTYAYETFTSSGRSISSAINTSAFGGCASNLIKVSAQIGEVYVIQVNGYKLNSGTNPTFKFVNSIIGAAASKSNSYTPTTNGDLRFLLTVNAVSNIWLEIGVGNGIAANWSIDNISVMKLKDDWALSGSGSITRNADSSLTFQSLDVDTYISLPYTPTQNQVHELSFDYLKDSNDVKVNYTINNQTDSTETVTNSYQTATKSFIGGSTDTLKISLSDTGKVKIKNPSLIKKNSWVVNRNDTLNIPYTLATDEVGSFNGTITAYTTTGNKTSNLNWDVEYSLADYYVSNNGSDSADGLSELTAWRTLEKVNEHDSAYGFNSGDKILLEANSTWKGKLKINSSGTEEAPILIDWYHEELNNKPTITNAEYISGYTIHSAGGSTVLDTVEQRLANISTTGTISGEYIVGRKVTFVDGTLNKYFMRTLQKTPVKTQMKLYTKTGATSFSVVPSSESVVKTFLADSVNSWDLITPLTVTAGDYWIVLVAEQGVTNLKIPYQTGGADTNYFIHSDNNSWNTGLSNATFPSTITPNLSFQELQDGAIGAEIETSSGSSGTIYKTVIADLEQVKLNSVPIAKRVDLVDLDDENEYTYSNDTLYTFQDTTLNRIIKDGGVQLLGDNITVKNLYVSYSDTAFALNGHNIILDSVYTVNNGFGFVNNDKAEITRSGFIGNMTSVSNDSLNLNTSIFINSGLWDSSAVLLDGGISDITHNSFRSSYAGESYLKDQNSIRTLVNNAFQNDYMDFTIKLLNIMPIASNNAYGGVFSFKAEGNTTSSAATWADWLGEPFYVATATISFTSEYNLTPSSTSSLLVDNGLSTTISKDYYSNPFRYAGTLTDIGAIELQDTVSTETDPIPSGTNIFVTNSGSTNYSDGFNESVGITYATLKTNFSSVSNNTNILFKRGETFENVYLQVNTKSNLFFSSYGTGSKPILRGKTALTSISNASKWTKVTDSTWTYQLTSGTSEYPVTSLLYRVWLNGQEYQFAHYTNRGGLGSALVIDPLITEDMKISRNFRWEYDGSRAKLKVYVPAGQLPYSYYTNIEYVGKYPDILEFKYCDGIEISNLQLEGGYFGSMMLEESLDFDVHDNIMYDGGQGLVRVRGDLADNNLIHDNLIDSRFNLIHFAPVRYEPENYHLVDIQWGADNNKVFDNTIKNGGISHFRIITIVGSGLSENNWFYNNTVTSELAYARPIHITTLSSSSADAPTSTYIFNNYFGNMKTRMQVGGRDTRFFYNVFDTLKGLQDVKVLHHYGATSEAYEINDFDDFLHQFADASAKLGNFYFFNNTIYTAGREAIRFGLIFDGDDGNYYLNNLIINSCDASTYNGYYTDLYFPLYTYPRPNIVKNNFSWHKTRSNTSYANYYNETWYNWSDFNSAETGSDVFSGNIQKGVSDIANVNLIFQDLSNNDFRVKTGLGITNGGVNVSSYLPYTPFYDRNGIRVDNDTAPNIGALNNP